MQEQEKASGIKEMTDCILAKLEILGEKMESMEKVVQQNYDKNAKEIGKVVTTLTDALLLVNAKVDEIQTHTKKLETRINQTDLKVNVVDEMALKLENEITLLQFKNMECAVRLRGIPERSKEDLMEICSQALAKLLSVNDQQVMGHQVAPRIDRIYRVNSWYARQRNLPRDVVIYFTDTRIRNDVVFHSFHDVVRVDGKEIRVYKELPPRMLRLRKEFRFLAVELKKQEILFRWEAPVGISFNYEGKHYRLLTVEKAREFYSNILRTENTSSSPCLVLEEGEEEKEDRELIIGSTPSSPRLALEEKEKEEDKEELELNEEFLKETEEQIAQMEKAKDLEQLGATGGIPQDDFFLQAVIKEKPISKRQKQYQKPKEQRQHMTRQYTSSQREKHQKDARPMLEKSVVTSKPQQSEAMGGARSKVADQNLQQMLGELRHSLNDN